MNLIRKFNEDSVKLSKREFGTKYILAIFIIVFSWMSIYLLSNILSTKENLTHIKCTIKRNRIYENLNYRKNGTTYITKDLQLLIHENNNSYNIKSKYDFSKVYNTLKIGDTIDIYTESSLSYFIFPIDTYEVFEVDKNGEILFDFKQIKNMSLMFLAFFGGLAVFSIIIRRYTLNKLRKPTNREIEGLLK